MFVWVRAVARRTARGSRAPTTGRWACGPRWRGERRGSRRCRALRCLQVRSYDFFVVRSIETQIVARAWVGCCWVLHKSILSHTRPTRREVVAAEAGPHLQPAGAGQRDTAGCRATRVVPRAYSCPTPPCLSNRLHSPHGGSSALSKYRQECGMNRVRGIGCGLRCRKGCAEECRGKV